MKKQLALFAAGSTSLVLRHLAERGDVKRADIVRLIAPRHASNNGQRDVMRRLIERGLVEVGYVRITDKGRAALKVLDAPEPAAEHDVDRAAA